MQPEKLSSASPISDNNNSGEAKLTQDRSNKNLFKKPRVPQNLKLSILLFGGSSSLVLTLGIIFLKNFISKSSAPNFGVFIATGLIGILLTAALFIVISKLGMGFKKSTLTLAFGYNSLIVVIKLSLSPASL